MSKHQQEDSNPVKIRVPFLGVSTAHNKPVTSSSLSPELNGLAKRCRNLLQ
ncbi:hypothetical protein AB6C85_23740 [Vibrio splendidus]